MDKNYSIGSWITLGHLSIAEVMAGAGFDWLCVDLEHSVIDYYDLQVLLNAIQGKGVKAFARIGANDSTIIKRVLDAGANGIICPMVNTPEDAKRLVSNVKYPPLGTRGVGLARAQNYGLDEGFENYKTNSANNITIIAQIEHIDGLKNFRKIVEVEGIDGTFIGPYDLSGSIGKPGRYDDDNVKEMLVSYEKMAKESGKLMGFHVIKPEYELVQEKIDKGYNFIAFSIDTLFLGQSCRNELKKRKKL